MQKLQRDNPHSHQVRAMDALITFGDYRVDTQQPRAFRRPIARGARSIFFSRKNHQRHALGNIFFRRFEDAHLGTVGKMSGEAALKISSPSSERDRLLIEGQSDDNVCALAARTRDFQLSVHLFNPLAHSSETQTAMSIS